MTNNETIYLFWELTQKGKLDNDDYDKLTKLIIEKGLMTSDEDLKEVDLRNEAGWVYVVYIGKGQFKIGETKHLKMRLMQIQPKEILATIRTNRRLLLEKQLHAKYADCRLTPSQEVFSLTSDQIQELYEMEDEINFAMTKNSLF